MTTTETMTADLKALLARVEGATGPSDELDALILCALVAPAGCYVERSKYNGAWCIFEPMNGRSVARLWEDRGPFREGGWPLTSSLDATTSLVERVRPGWAWGVGNTEAGSQAYLMKRGAGLIGGRARSPALALLSALLRSLIETDNAE